MKIFAGPWVGEFGWELFCWQGYLRQLAFKLKQNDSQSEFIVSCRPGHEVLYEDFATRFDLYSPPSEETTEWKNKSDPDPGLPLHHFQGKWVSPNKVRLTWSPMNEKFKNQNFKIFGRPNRCPSMVLIHARSTDKYDTGYRNYPREGWGRIIDRIHSQHGAIVANIGSTSQSMRCHQADLDLRGIALWQLADYMANAICVIGPSSGPIHLASLCACPHLTWSGDRGNKRRYEEVWNPFNTPCAYVSDSWRPEVSQLIKEIDIFIDRARTEKL